MNYSAGRLQVALCHYSVCEIDSYCSEINLVRNNSGVEDCRRRKVQPQHSTWWEKLGGKHQAPRIFFPLICVTSGSRSPTSDRRGRGSGLPRWWWWWWWCEPYSCY